jgi:predicted Zn-dependent protease
LAALPGRGVVIVDEQWRTDLRFAANTLTTNGVARFVSATVIAMDDRPDGTAVGTSTASVRSEQDAANLAHDALTRARTATTLRDAGPLPSAVVDDGFDQPSPGTDPGVLNRTAQGLGAAFGRAATSSIEWFGYAEHTMSSTWLGTTEGARRVHHQPAGRLEATGKGQARSTSVWEGRATRDFLDVDVEDVEVSLRRRLEWSTPALDIDPGRYRVILPAGALVDLMTPMLWSGSARDAREGLSAFSDPQAGTRIGERWARDSLTLASDPHHALVPARGFVAAAASGPLASVFDNGLDLEAVEWIRDGQLQHLIGPRSEQRHTPAARNATDNLVITDTAGAGGLDELIARTDEALLLTCLWYIREVDPQTMLSTGLTRDGVYVVREGRIVGSAGNFRFNESPLDLMNRIVDAGASSVAQPREWADYSDANVAPPVVVEGFNLSTRSDAT